MRWPLLILMGVTACSGSDKAGDTATNAPPSAPVLALDAADSTQDLTVRIAEPSVDPEGAAVVYTYAWTVDGAASDLRSDTIPADQHTRGELWEVTVTASDGTRAADPVTASTTIGNAPPTAAVAISPSAPRSPDELVASPSGIDPEDDPVTFAFAWTVDGVDAGIDGPIVPPSATARNQRWEVRVTPNDGTDDGRVVTASAVIGNLPPVLSDLVLTPGVPGTNDTLTATPEASDPDDDPVTVAYAWSVNGEVVQEGPEDTLPSTAFARGDTVFVTGTPSDGAQEGAPLTSESVSVQNAPPEVLTAALDADTVTQDDMLSLIDLTTTDADGDEVTTTVAWHLDGEVLPDETEPTLSVDGLPRDGSITAVITPTDGVDDGEPFETAPTTIINTTPRVIDPAIAPDPAYEDSLVVFDADIVDPDGDPLDSVYTWRVDGLVVQEGPLASITGELFDRYQVIEATLAVDDGSGPVIVDVGPVDVDNSPPTVAEVALSADVLTERDVLGCEAIEPYDADGDEVFLEVVWVVNGFRLDIGPVIDGEWFNRGDEVWCEAEPSDGITRGAVFESPHLLVQNASPDAPEAGRLEPADHRYGLDPLQCIYDGEYPSDPDRDLVALMVRWFADGVEVEVEATSTLYANDTLPAQATLQTRHWSCVFDAVDAVYESTTPGSRSPELESVAAGGNVLVVLLDDVGTDMLGVYDEHPSPPPTPRLDALADEGLLFRNAYSAPVCSPTRAAMLTGRLGRRYGLGVIVDAWDVLHPLPDSEVLIPRMLEQSPDLDYASSVAGKWHLGNSIQGLSHPADMGFDWHAGSMDNLRTPSVLDDGREKSYEMWVKNTNGTVDWEDTYATTDSIDDAISRMATMPEPWFLYVPLNAAHSPVHVPPRHLHSQDIDEDSSDSAKYRAVVEATDTEIGRLLDAIPAPVAARTTVMVLGDNGSPDWAITPPRTAPQYKGTLYEGGINVPFIVRSPFVTEAGSETDALVHVVDVFATTAILAGVDPNQVTRPDLLGGPDTVIETDGESLLPFFTDPDHPSLREYVFSERFANNGEGPYTYEDKRAIRDERWKLIRLQTELGPIEDRFFDLAEDDLETVDLLTEGPLTPEAADAYDRLDEALGEQMLALVYDVPALPPVVRDVIITPEDAAYGDRLTCEVGFYGDLNPDVVELLYDWAIGDSWLGIDSAVLDTAIAGPGARIQCSVTPFDGVLYGEPGLAEIVLAE